MAISQALLAVCGALLGLTILAPPECRSATLSRRALVASEGNGGKIAAADLGRNCGRELMPSAAEADSYKSLMAIPKGAKVTSASIIREVAPQTKHFSDGTSVTVGGRFEAGRTEAAKKWKGEDGTHDYHMRGGYVDVMKYELFENSNFNALKNPGAWDTLLQALPGPTGSGTSRAALPHSGSSTAALPYSGSHSRSAGPRIEELPDDEPDHEPPQSHAPIPTYQQSHYHDPETQDSPVRGNVQASETLRQIHEDTKPSHPTNKHSPQRSPSTGRSNRNNAPIVELPDDDEDDLPSQTASRDVIPPQTTSRDVIPPQTISRTSSAHPSHSNGSPQSASQGHSPSNPPTPKNIDHSLDQRAKPQKSLKDSSSKPLSPLKLKDITFKEFSVILKRRFEAQPATEILPFGKELSKLRSETVLENEKLDTKNLIHQYVDWINSNVENPPPRLLTGKGRDYAIDTIAAATQNMNFDERVELMHPGLTVAEEKDLEKFMISEGLQKEQTPKGEPWSDGAVEEQYKKWKQTSKPWTFHWVHFWQKMFQKLDEINEKILHSFRRIWTGRSKSPAEVHTNLS